MKTMTHPALASLAALALACSPVLLAQETAAPDQSQNSRAHDSTADMHASDTGSPASQPGTLEKNNSKDASSETRDANPSTAPTDSAIRSGTKNPSDATELAKAEKKQKPASDRQFILSAAQGGMTEVELGKLASEKASSSGVKSLGERMVNDHSRTDAQLKGIAQQKGVKLPERLDSRHQAMVDKLGKLNGPAFDKAYVKMTLRDHEKDAREFKHVSKASTDPQVKTFASDTLPTIQSRLDEAKSLQGQLK